MGSPARDVSCTSRSLFGGLMSPGWHSTHWDSGTPCTSHQSSEACISRPAMPERRGMVHPVWCPCHANSAMPASTMTVRAARATRASARARPAGSAALAALPSGGPKPGSETGRSFMAVSCTGRRGPQWLRRRSRHGINGFVTTQNDRGRLRVARCPRAAYRLGGMKPRGDGTTRSAKSEEGELTRRRHAAA